MPNVKTRTLFTVTVNFLSKQEYSIQDLKYKLLKRGYPLEDIETTLNELVKLNLQSDQRFAQSYLKQKQSLYGNWRLKEGLKQHGISDSDIALAFSQVNPDEEKIRATPLLERKFEHEKRKEALFRFLKNKGFAVETIYAVLAKMNVH